MARSLRHQLPAYSPITLPSLIAALASSATGVRDSNLARELLRAHFAADDALLVDSGRSALQLAIRAALARFDAERRLVALPAYSCYEVATAAVGADARIALYDVDPGTLSPSLDSLEARLREGARVVVIAPLYGIPVDWDRVSALLARYDAFGIEDAAQSHGAEWRGARLGSLGELSVVSFGRGKGWTGGGGGALLSRGTRAAELVAALTEPVSLSAARRAKIIATTTIQWAAGRPSVYGVPAGIPGLGLGETTYHDPTPAAGASRFSAALLRRTLAMASDEIERRRRSAERWLAELPAAARAAVPRGAEGGVAGYMRLPLLVSSSAAGIVRSAEARRLGMVPSYPKTLAQLPAVAARLDAAPGDLAGAGQLAREVVTLPTHSRVSEADRRAVLDILARVFA